MGAQHHQQGLTLVVFLLASVLLVVESSAQASTPVEGKWYLNLNISQTNIYTSLAITRDNETNAFSGVYQDDLGSFAIYSINYNTSTQFLDFYVNETAHKAFYWFSGSIVQGIIRGRFSMSSIDGPKPFSDYIYHFTGWNEVVFPLQTPLAYDITIYGNCSAKLRIDRDPTNATNLVGRFKVYFCFSGEELEYDLESVQWDGTNIAFVRIDVVDGWDQSFKGQTSGNTIVGQFVDTRTPGTSQFAGKRANVLSYGLFPKSESDRLVWQTTTRERVEHLLMYGNPPPVGEPIFLEWPVLLNQSYDTGASRDDNPQHWPQNFTVTEYHFQYQIQDPYAPDVLIARNTHAYLAMPDDIKEGEKLPAYLAVNGHGGSGWQQLFPGPTDIYWYGNGFGRRRFIILSVDISHRNDSPLYEDFKTGDDPTHGNGAHPSIKSSIFNTTDWEEDGERTWDARRGMDFLLTLPQVDPSRVVVGGLSMGGGITTYVAALDLRIQGGLPAGWSPDLDVILHHKNHPCYLWVYANIREYLDSSDLIALVAPRPFIVETGKVDYTFSYRRPAYPGDKQVARRSRIAFGAEVDNFVHYLHYDMHRYHVGDVNPLNASAEMYVREPVLIAPVKQNDLTWQVDGTTTPVTVGGKEPFTLFDLVSFWLDN